MWVSPPPRAICSRCSDRRLPTPVARDGALTWRNASCATPGPEMWHDDTNANQTSAGERIEGDPAVVDVLLVRVQLGLDGVFAVTVQVPPRRAPVVPPRYQLSAARCS